jgi:ferric-dicitrate binding protein FerR (iron transport regulator)
MDASERRNRASTEAADWFARLQAGEMERAERQQFVEWLRESYIHVTEMLRIAQIHGELKQFEHWARISTGPKTADENVVQLPSAPDDNPPQMTGEGRRPRSRKGESLQRPPLMFFAVAATVVLTVATAMVLPKIRGQVIETERGERRQVVLSDGSLLQVDPETRLRVKFADKVRQVFLEHGRALFHVAKNAHRPFLVQANGTTVRAVGTAFGVEEQARGVIVTVAEGKVAVIASTSFQSPLYPHPNHSTSQGEGAPLERMRNANSSPSVPLQQLEKAGPAKREGEGASASPSDREGRDSSPGVQPPSPTTGEGRGTGGGTGEGTLFLTADQQVMVPSGGAAEAVREVDSHRALAWAEGRLIFKNDELGKVIAEFNRYNRVQLIVADPTLAAKPVSGVFNAADPEAFIAFLQSVTAVEIARDGDVSITIGTVRRP